MAPSDHRPTLLHALLHWEQVQPDKIYLTQPLGNGEVIHYRWKEVGNQVRCMAAYLQSMNFPPRTQIALLGKNSAHWIMADLAILMAGHVTVPLYPTLNAEGAQYILEHSEARLIFLGKLDGKSDGWNEIRNSIPQHLPKIGLPLSPGVDIPQWDDIIATTPALTALDLPDPDQLATIIYTSGSTGKPKGVMHSFRSMSTVPQGINEMFGPHHTLSEHDRMLSYLPLAHAAERAIVESLSLHFGFQVFFTDNLLTFPADLRRAQPTIFFSVPRLWTKFYQAIEARLPQRRQNLLFRLPLVGRLLKQKILTQLGLRSVRFAITGSAPLPSALVSWYRGLGLELLDCYGMSENFAYSHTSRPGRTRVGYVGECNPGAQCRIAENGEIQVKSPGQMLGYFKDAAKMAKELTADGFFMTGDRGEIDAQGRLKITGRVKELFKTSKGKYVAPVPIENKLTNHPKIEAVCVTGSGQPQPFALVMLSPEAQNELAKSSDRRAWSLELETLLDDVNATLEDHETLDYLVVVNEQWTMENGFLTPTMKIKRSVIEQSYLHQGDDWLATRRKIIWASSPQT